jgi:PAS domain S-box-containing protein
LGWQRWQFRSRRWSIDEKQLQFVDETPAYLWVTSPDGENLFINKPLAKFLGTGDRRLARRWLDFIHPDDAAQVAERLKDCMAARTEYFHEHRVRRFDGEYRWVAGRSQPCFSFNGKFAGYAGALFDITERKTAEDLARRNAELLLELNRTLELIASNAPLPHTLDSLLRAVEAQMPDMLSSILLLDADGLHLRHGAAPRLPETFIRAIDGKPIGPVAGSCGTAAFRREAVVVEDIDNDPLWLDYRDVALRHGLQACWSTPIFDEQQRVLGTFALYFRAPRRPDESHWKLIESVAHRAAIAIVRHRETEALACSEERLRLAIAAGNVGIWDWDLTTSLLTWNDRMKTMFGRPTGVESESDITVPMFLELLHREDRPRIEAAMQNSISNHTDHKGEFRVVWPDGSERWIAGLGRGQYDASGNAVRMSGVAIDITDEKRADEENKRREAQLVYAQHIAQLGSYEWDIRANRVYRSAELCRIFGLHPDEFEPTFEGYLERVHPEDRKSTRDTIKRALRECTPFAFEERIVRGDGNIRILYSQGQWVPDDQGQPIKLVGTCQDITERKQAEERLHAAYTVLAMELEERTRTEQQIRALSAVLINAQEEERTRLARELHDDLSQQIAAVSIATSNLRKGIPAENSELHMRSDRIQQNLMQLAESVRRLSHELHPAVLQHAGLGAALEAYCSEIGELTGIKILLETDGAFDGVPPAVALCVYRIAQEGLRNVVKHAKVNEARVCLRHSGGKLRLTICDSGVGMTSQREIGTTGLGLISIKERARLVNGAVEIHSEANRGTTLTLEIPIPGDSG